VAEGTPDEVIGQGSNATIVRVRLPAGAPSPPAELMAGAVHSSVDATSAESVPSAAAPSDSGSFEFHTHSATAFVHRLTGWAVEAGFAFDDLTVTRPSLEDTYLALTGGAGAEDDGEPELTADPGLRRRSRRGR
jgi:ABC-2 type transport system ATP-binding protein